MKNKGIQSLAFLALRQLIVFSALCSMLAVSATAAGDKTLMGHVPAAVRDYNLQPLGRLPANSRLNLVIGLPFHNTEAIASLIQQIYDPASTNYHRYLTPDQFTQRFGPTEQEYQSVIHFAETNGFEVGSRSGDRVLLHVSASVSNIERAFHVNLQTYQHPTEPRQFFAPDVEPSVDASLPIIFISGLNNFYTPHSMVRGAPASKKVSPAAGSAPDGFSYIGKDFRTAYAPGVTLTGSGEMVGLVELEGYYASDISAYESAAGISAGPVQNVPLDGFTLNAGDTSGILECSLDIEMVISVAPGLSKLFVFEDSSSTDDILQSMVASNQIKQFSSSWALSEDPMAEGYLMQMAADGQTFFQASGDGDAYVSSCGAIPWPSDDLYVTSVGGTTLNMTADGGAYVSESVWNSGLLPPPGWFGNCMSGYWGSGGGVSTSFGIPLWQQGANVSAVGGSTTMRNIPDVAMVANGVWVNYNHTTLAAMGEVAIGTSIAAPLWGGFTALINQQAATEGLSPVGFLDPAFYAIGQGSLYSSTFNDITSGNNYWPSSPTKFAAATGFDLCTGWGTPKGMNLINALMAYGSAVWVDFNYTGATINGTYDFPYKTMAQATTAVPSGGNIWIRTAGSSSETMTISKPMTIRAYNGAATIGQ
ncbi:MAG TPA: S53 family peptidase [Alphaproteobacteria bacterium]|nr:S53 family peptidase [Alphaproteobacteria bacterium]